MKRLKESGISMLALVITIIILLILACVTMGVVTSNNGLFDKSKQATDEYNNSVNDEKNKMAEAENLIDTQIVAGNREYVDKAEFLRLEQRYILLEQRLNYLSSGYPNGTKELIDGNAFDSSAAVKKWTPPVDGWVIISAEASGSGGKWYSLSSGSLSLSGGSNAWQNYTEALPCKAGVEVSYVVWGQNVTGKLYYIPMYDLPIEDN